MVSSVAIGATAVVVGLTIIGGGGWVAVAVAVGVVVGRGLVGTVVGTDVVRIVSEVDGSLPMVVGEVPSNAELDPQPASMRGRADQANTARTSMGS